MKSNMTLEHARVVNEAEHDYTFLTVDRALDLLVAEQRTIETFASAWGMSPMEAYASSSKKLPARSSRYPKS